MAATSVDRRFYLPMAIACAAIIFLGFTPSFYLKNVIHAPPPLSWMTIVHGSVFTAWTLLFVLQSALIGYDRPALHRQLGVLGAVLFGVVFTLGITTAIIAGRLGHAPPEAPAPLAFMALPIFAICGIAVLVLLALANRLRSDFHKRYMLAGFIGMTGPAVARIVLGAGQAAASTWAAILIPDLLLAGAMAYDLKTQKRVHPAYWWSAAIMLGINAGAVWGFYSPLWLSFATWLTQSG